MLRDQFLGECVKELLYIYELSCIQKELSRGVL